MSDIQLIYDDPGRGELEPDTTNTLCGPALKCLGNAAQLVVQDSARVSTHEGAAPSCGYDVQEPLDFGPEGLEAKMSLSPRIRAQHQQQRCAFYCSFVC